MRFNKILIVATLFTVASISTTCAQTYIPLDKLCNILAKMNENQNAYDFSDPVKTYGFTSDALQGTYRDGKESQILCDRRSFNRSFGNEEDEIFYTVSATMEHIAAIKKDLDEYFRFESALPDKTEFYESWNGRFNIMLTKKINFWEICLYENLPNPNSSMHWAIDNGPGMLYINSYTNFSNVLVHKGDKVYFHNTGTVITGDFSGGCGPVGHPVNRGYNIVGNLNYGALLTCIDTGRRHERWLPAGEDTMIVAPITGFLKFMVNDTDPKDNKGNFYVEYSINKPLPYPVKQAAPAVAAGQAAAPASSLTEEQLAIIHKRVEEVKEKFNSAALINATNLAGVWKGAISGNNNENVNITFDLKQSKQDVYGVSIISTETPDQTIRFFISGGIADGSLRLTDVEIMDKTYDRLWCKKDYVATLSLVNGVLTLSGTYSSSNSQAFTKSRSEKTVFNNQCTPGTFTITKVN